MSRMFRSHIAVLLAIGAIVPMQSLGLRPGLAETLGNGVANGFAAIAISDSAAGPAGTTAVGGIAIGPDSLARTQNATQPCTGSPPFTNCGHGNIAVGISSQAINDFAVAIGFLSRASGFSDAAFGANAKANGGSSFAAGNNATANGVISIAIGFSSFAADSAVALGSQANASGRGAIAMGQGTTATGSRSFAAGTSANSAGNDSSPLATRHQP
jgi:hypothetical protein